MALFHELGFESHTFAKTNADEETNLVDYFVSPPFFESMIGDPKRIHHQFKTPGMMLCNAGRYAKD